MQRLSTLPVTSLSRLSAAHLPALSTLGAAPARLQSTKASNEKKIVQYTSFAMAGLIPAALFVGSPFVGLADYVLAVGIPAHMYIGARSILIDYVPDESYQRIAIAALGGVTALTAFGLLKLNVTDVGVVEGLKLLWKKPSA